MAAKRKAGAANSAVQKKKSTSGTTSSAKKRDEVTVDQIQRLVAELDDLSPKKYNNIAILISHYDHLTHTTEKGVITLRTLTVGLYNIFDKLIASGGLGLKKTSDESSIKITKWLKSKYAAYLDLLFKFLQISDVEEELFNSFQIDILRIVVKLIKVESKWFAPNVNEPFFSIPLYKRLIETLLTWGNVQDVVESNGLNNGNFLLLEFYDTYFAKYWDLKYYFVSELQGLISEHVEDASKEQKQVFYANYLTIMRNTMYTNYEDAVKSTLVAVPPKVILKQAVFKTNFEKNWLAVLNNPLLESQYKQTLLIFHKRIIPFLNNPTKFMDFLTDSYDIGFQNRAQESITISILALNGLFELMKNYNLEYPGFYEKLYAILNNQLLHLGQKSRFFRMLDLFLSSTHLPSNLVASFIKRLSKLTLTAPPSGIVIVIPLVYNLLKRHPTCMVLVHNTTRYDNYTDPFDPLEADPLKTMAIESSVWELSTMMNHYHPNVASLAKIFSQPFNKYSYNLEDFLDWNYPSLLNSELTKRFKGDLSLEFEEFDTLFTEPKSSSSSAYIGNWSW